MKWLAFGLVLLVGSIRFYPSKGYVTPPLMCFVMTTDDHDIAYTKDLADVVYASGGRMTAFVVGAYVSEAEEAVLLQMAQQGHEISNHTWSHYKLDVTTPLTITSTNTNPTVRIDAAGQQIILSCDEVGNRVTVSWASASKSVADVETAAAGKGWTFTMTTYTNTPMKMASFADTGGSLSVPRGLVVDVSAPDYPHWREEILGNRTYLGGVTGTTPGTFSWPNGAYTTAAISYLYAQEYRAARGVNPGPDYLDSIAIYNTQALAAGGVLGDGSEATIRANVRAFYDACYEKNGCLFAYYTHSAGETSVEQVGWIVDEVIDAGGSWITFDEAMQRIKASMDTSDGLTYVRRNAR